MKILTGALLLFFISMTSVLADCDKIKAKEAFISVLRDYLRNNRSEKIKSLIKIKDMIIGVNDEGKDETGKTKTYRVIFSGLWAIDDTHTDYFGVAEVDSSCKITGIYAAEPHNVKITR